MKNKKQTIECLINLIENMLMKLADDKSFGFYLDFNDISINSNLLKALLDSRLKTKTKRTPKQNRVEELAEMLEEIRDTTRYELTEDVGEVIN